jgi:hypothetical protein
MTSRTAHLATVLVFLLVAGCHGAGDLGGVSTLGPRFDAQTGQVRLVALLSPT